MTIKQLVKGMAVALPMLTLAACSSTSQSTSAGDTEQQTNAGTDTAATAPANTVETGTIEPVLTAAEQIEQQKQALMADNVIYFAFDQSQISPEYIDVLSAHAEFLRENPEVTLLIEGHTDERGTPDYNIGLGERRANSVGTYLMSVGVVYSQLETVSYGELKPVDPAHNEVAWEKNRRAVLSY